MTKPAADIGIVVIGRNEGARLVRCLASLNAAARDMAARIVYVDSGSTDGSLDAATHAGAEVVSLDMSQPFSAGRARNAGVDQLAATGPLPAYVQFIDGDCTLNAGWLQIARDFLEAYPQAAIACGRLREQNPQGSIYNHLADAEWNTPVGEAKACGGIMMMRSAPFVDLKGFRPDLIAGEEPELCVRLRQAGWTIWRLDAEMALHDIAMTRFSQWWGRARRAGHAYAEGAVLHGAPPERHNVSETRRALVWGVALPLLILLLALLISPWALLLALIWPLQVLRLKLRGETWVRALFLTIGKFPEAIGIVNYHLKRWLKKPVDIIEYK